MDTVFLVVEVEVLVVVVGLLLGGEDVVMVVLVSGMCWSWFEGVGAGPVEDIVAVVLLEGCEAVGVTWGRVDLYLMSVKANLALLASMGGLEVFGVAGGVVEGVLGEKSWVMVSISSSDSVVVSRRPAIATGSSTGASSQNSQLSSNEMESVLSSMMVGVTVAVGRDAVLVECLGKVRSPFVPRWTRSILILFASGLGPEAASSWRACSSAIVGTKVWVWGVWRLWLVCGWSRYSMTVSSTFCACRGSPGRAGAGGELEVVMLGESGEEGVLRDGRSVIRGWLVVVQHSQQFSEGCGALKAPVSNAL